MLISYGRPDVHKFFTGGPYPGLSDNGDATKMHQAYGLFVRGLTYQSVTNQDLSALFVI